MARNNMGKNTDVATLLKARIMVSLTQCIPLPSASRFWAGDSRFFHLVGQPGFFSLASCDSTSCSMMAASAPAITSVFQPVGRGAEVMVGISFS